jgi:Kef-type K+ transport system membrane component KefB
MISRGEVGLIIAALSLQTGLPTERGFAIMVIIVLPTTVMTPLLPRVVFPLTPSSEETALEAAFAESKTERGITCTSVAGFPQLAARAFAPLSSPFHAAR